MSRAERDKGKRGEREWAALMTKAGLPTRRGKQYRGDETAPDVVTESILPLYGEVKRRQRLNVRKVYNQAVEEKGPLDVAYVAHRGDNEEWLVTLSGKDFTFLATLSDRLVKLVKSKAVRIKQSTEEE